MASNSIQSARRSLDEFLSPGNRWRPRLLISLIILAAALLRVWNIGAGIPHAVGVDEPQIMDRAVRMMKTGDFNPRFFDWPSLTIYVHFAVVCLTFLGGAMRGAWSHLDQVGPADFYLASRIVTAAAGVATVAVIYAAGRRWGRGEALLAAALLTVIPNHVAGSHYVSTDVPTAFFTTIVFLFALRACERQTLPAFILAGAAVGLAAATKYNGLSSLVLPLLGGCLTAASPAQAAQRILVVCGSAAAAFLVATPYALLDLPRFLNDYARLAAIFARPRTGEPGWLIYLKHLRIALGWPALAMAFVGLAAAGWRIGRGPARVRWALLASFPVVYFSVMAGSYQIYGRYLMPLFPFASLLAAVGVTAGVRAATGRALPRRAVVLATVAAIAIVLVPPGLAAIGFDRNLGRVGTVDLAYRWILQHVPSGSKIALETRALVLPRQTYHPVYVRSLAARSHAEYASESYDYILASSEQYRAAFDEPHLHRAAYQRYQTLFTESEEVASFQASENTPGPTLRLFRIRR